MQSNPLPRENVYGHTKKLTLLIKAIGNFVQEKKTEKLDILDFGCGNGSAVTQYIASLGHSVVGIDLHGPSIEYAKNKVQIPTCEFIEGNGQTLITLKRKFDVIIFSDLLEHVENPNDLLLEAKKLLKTDGLILVTIPNGRGPFEIESYVSRIPYIGKTSIQLVNLFVAVLNKFVFKGAWSKVVTDNKIPYNIDSGHIQFFTKKSFLKICRAGELKVKKVQNITFLSGPYTNHLFSAWKKFCEINAKIADFLPMWLVSAWFFEITSE